MTNVNATSVKSLSCPSCGGAIVLRAPGWTQNVACANCGALLDAQDPNLRILQAAKRAIEMEPQIPLGTRGQWRGAQYEVIGYQQVSITVETVQYGWSEYLLFNPYHGFRYLTEYDGHWNDVVALLGVPVVTAGTKPVAQFAGRTFRHFQTAVATTRYVLGEFPWEIRVGDTVTASDYVDPPFVLSAEEAAGEMTWSQGEYVDGSEVWRAFKVDGSPPAVRGIYANQPSPHKSSSGMWSLYGIFALVLVALMCVRAATASNREVHAASYVFQRADSGAAAFVTPAFDIAAGNGNVVVEVESDISNSWMYLNYTLINENTGAIYDFGREVSFYSGYDTDGPYKEGSPGDRARVANVPGGRYFLRVETERPPESGAVRGVVRVLRDVPSFAPFLLALLALFMPPFVAAIRSASFESKRWAESDHAPVVSSDDDDEEE